MNIAANVPPALRSWGFLFPNYSDRSEVKYTKRPFHKALKPQFLKTAVIGSYSTFQSLVTEL